MVIAGKDQALEAEYGKQYTVMGFSPSRDFSGEVAFIGYSVIDKQKHYSSFSELGPDDLKGEEPHLKQLSHLAMLARDIHLSPRGTLALSLPMGEVETDALLAAVDAFVEDYGPLLPRAAPAA